MKQFKKINEKQIPFIPNIRFLHTKSGKIIGAFNVEKREEYNIFELEENGDLKIIYSGNGQLHITNSFIYPEVHFDDDIHNIAIFYVVKEIKKAIIVLYNYNTEQAKEIEIELSDVRLVKKICSFPDKRLLIILHPYKAICIAPSGNILWTFDSSQMSFEDYNEPMPNQGRTIEDAAIINDKLAALFIRCDMVATHMTLIDHQGKEFRSFKDLNFGMDMSHTFKKEQQDEWSIIDRYYKNTNEYEWLPSINYYFTKRTFNNNWNLIKEKQCVLSSISDIHTITALENSSIIGIQKILIKDQKIHFVANFYELNHNTFEYKLLFSTKELNGQWKIPIYSKIVSFTSSMNIILNVYKFEQNNKYHVFMISKDGEIVRKKTLNCRDFPEGGIWGFCQNDVFTLITSDMDSNIKITQYLID